MLLTPTSFPFWDSELGWAPGCPERTSRGNAQPHFSGHVSTTSQGTWETSLSGNNSSTVPRGLLLCQVLAQAHYVPSLTEPSGEPWLCDERSLVKTTELVGDADQIRAHVMQNSKAPGYAAFELWPIQVGPDMTLPYLLDSPWTLHKYLWSSHCVPGNSLKTFFIEIHQHQQEKHQGAKGAFLKAGAESCEGGGWDRQATNTFSYGGSTGLRVWSPGC